MKLNCAACIILLLSFNNVHAVNIEDQLIGTWLVRDNLPHNTYITYHPPHHCKQPVRFVVTDHGVFCSEDILYGRYDVVLEMPGENSKVLFDSGIWFFLKDNEEAFILDLNHKDVDVENFSFPNAIVNSENGLAITRILRITGNQFIYEEYSPKRKSFVQTRSVKVPKQSLDQIRALPKMELPDNDEL